MNRGALYQNFLTFNKYEKLHDECVVELYTQYQQGQELPDAKSDAFQKRFAHRMQHVLMCCSDKKSFKVQVVWTNLNVIVDDHVIEYISASDDSKFEAWLQNGLRQQFRACLEAFFGQGIEFRNIYRDSFIEITLNPSEQQSATKASQEIDQ